jgi:hypothetical protein
MARLTITIPKDAVTQNIRSHRTRLVVRFPFNGRQVRVARCIFVPYARLMDGLLDSYNLR